MEITLLSSFGVTLRTFLLTLHDTMVFAIIASSYDWDGQVNTNYFKFRIQFNNYIISGVERVDPWGHSSLPFSKDVSVIARD